jgi:purine-nucleoside phosphorylase
MSLDAWQKSVEAAEYLLKRTGTRPTVLVILGSGLGGWADTLQSASHVPYADIPHFAQSTVEGHSGTWVTGTSGSVTLAAMQGRFHPYEGWAADDVMHPIRVAWQMGIRHVLVTNAAGSLHLGLQPGSLMRISDHINMTGLNPLVGPNDSRFGQRFPDMSRVYDAGLREVAMATAASLGQELFEGVYVGVRGPTYETPAEIRAFRTMGGDAVGMSTVFEVIAAAHLGMKVLGISCVTNLGSGLGGEVLNHLDVQDVAAKARERFTSLLEALFSQPEAWTP